jgi:hypothetical protein
MIRIFLEGKETKFIDYLIRNTWTGQPLNPFELINVGGWTNIHLIANKFNENTDAGGTNLVIFDADTLQNEGGFTKRLLQLEEKKIENAIDFNLFLFPNNQSDGDFELLLEQIINPNHNGLLNCFSTYENCLNQLNANAPTTMYKTPMRKAKIYSFIDAFLKNRDENEQMKKGDWFFHRSEYWDFNSPKLVPLKDFLLLHIVI